MKTVLITGASRGIGREVAKLFAEKGYAVLINYNNSKDQAESLQKELSDKGYYAKIYKADVSNKKETDLMVQTIIKDFKKIDVLVNNAGVSLTKLCLDVTENEYDNLFNINVKGMYFLTNAVLNSMIENKSGSIVNVSSIWGNVGASCEVAYSSSKSAVIGYTKALAKEVGLSGIRVNCVCPGVIDTDMNKNLTETDKKELAESTPLSRIGSATEVAECIYFLASEKASFITGQVVTVDGGFTL